MESEGKKRFVRDNIVLKGICEVALVFYVTVASLGKR